MIFITLFVASRKYTPVSVDKMVFEPVIFLFFFIVLVLSCFFYSKTYNEPIHPDSAEFIYPGLMQRLGFGKEYYQVYKNGRYVPAPLHFNRFPPHPEEIRDERFAPIGSYPRFRQKMLIWVIYELLFKYTDISPRRFRFVNATVFGATSFLLALIIYSQTGFVVALWWMTFFMLLLMLPHFDYYQIHAEIWGAFGLVAAFYCVILNSTLGNRYYLLLAGIILFVVFFLVKITFLPTTGLFILSPVILSGDWSGALSLTITIGVSLSACIVFLIIFGRGKPLLWTFNIANWGKYNRRASTSRSYSKNKQPDILTTGKLLRHYRLELGLVSVACGMGLIWLLAAEKTALQLVLALWVMTAALEILVQRKFYPAHYIPIIAPGIMFIALLPDSAVIILLKILFSIGVLILWLRWYVFNPLTLTEAYGHVSGNPFGKTLMLTEKVARFIRENSEPEDTIVVLGYASPVYVLAERKAALGIMECTLTLEPDNMNRLYGPRWWWWVKKSIRQSRAKFIIDFDGRCQVDELNQSTGLYYKLDRIISDTIRIFKLMPIGTPPGATQYPNRGLFLSNA